MRPNTPSETPSQEERPLRSKSHLAGYVLIGTAVLVGWFVLVGFMGWRSGEQLRTLNETQALTEQLDRQKELAAINITEGEYKLALSRLTWVLEQDSEDKEALTLKGNAEQGLTALFTPTPTPLIPPTPVPTSLPTPTAGPISSPEDELQRIRRLVALKEWETAVSAISNFQFEFPNYERQETDQHLYDAYSELALDNMNGDKVELGMYYLGLAATLGELSQAMLDYETWAELYLQGIAFYEVNWDAAAYYFRDLCLAAPFFQNSCSLLQEVLIQYGDQQVAAQEWCPAVELYTEASAYEFVPMLSEKLKQAEEMCALATPTPELLIPDETLGGTPTPTGEGGSDSLVFQTPTPTTGP